MYLLFDKSFILDDNLPAFYFLLKFRIVERKCPGARKAFWFENPISALAVAWAVHWQGAFRRHFAQLVKERKQECLCTSVSTFLNKLSTGWGKAGPALRCNNKCGYGRSSIKNFPTAKSFSFQQLQILYLFHTNFKLF